MTRYFHGCRVDSVPAPYKTLGDVVLCDGWHHTVFDPKGEEVGQYTTLAAAIAAAKHEGKQA
ncbi:MAG: hypothetical protein ACF8CY_05350 [Gimesia chilikensis]